MNPTAPGKIGRPKPRPISQLAVRIERQQRLAAACDLILPNLETPAGTPTNGSPRLWFRVK